MILSHKTRTFSNHILEPQIGIAKGSAIYAGRINHQKPGHILSFKYQL